jgi:hypothetical protein
MMVFAYVIDAAKLCCCCHGVTVLHIPHHHGPWLRCLRRTRRTQQRASTRRPSVCPCCLRVMSNNIAAKTRFFSDDSMHTRQPCLCACCEHTKDTLRLLQAQPYAAKGAPGTRYHAAGAVSTAHSFCATAGQQRRNSLLLPKAAAHRHSALPRRRSTLFCNT